MLASFINELSLSHFLYSEKDQAENLMIVHLLKISWLCQSSLPGWINDRSPEIEINIENSSRGIYSCSIEFFSYNQTFDLNIVIRTIVIHCGEASIGGGAIVALSTESEYEEMIVIEHVPGKYRL